MGRQITRAADPAGELARSAGRDCALSPRASAPPAKTRADWHQPFPWDEFLPAHSESFHSPLSWLSTKYRFPIFHAFRNAVGSPSFHLLLGKLAHAHVLGLGRAERQNRQRVPFLDHCVTGKQRQVALVDPRASTNNNDVRPGGLQRNTGSPVPAVRRSRTTGSFAGYDRRSSSWYRTGSSNRRS